MTQSVVIKPQNPVTPVSLDSDGNIVTDGDGNSVSAVVIGGITNDIYLAGQKTVGALTNRGSFQLFNPAASGFNLKVTNAIVKGNSGLITAYSNTTALSNDVTAGAVMSLNIGGTASIAEMYWDDLVAGAIPDIVDQGDAGFALLNTGTVMENVIGATIPPGYGLVLENSENNTAFMASFQFYQDPV